MEKNKGVNIYFKEILKNISPFILSEKTKVCLKTAIHIAARENAEITDMHITRGCISSRSIALPALDSMGVNIGSFNKDLIVYSKEIERRNYEIWGSDQSGFNYGLNSYLDKNSRPGYVMDRVLSLAKVIAKNENKKIIDSSILLRANIQCSADSSWKISDDSLNKLARRPLSELMSEYSRSEADDNLKKNSDNLEDAYKLLYNDWDVISYTVETMTKHIVSIDGFKNFEKYLAFAKNIEPFIENQKLILIPTSSKIIIRPFDYLNTYQNLDLELPNYDKVNIVAGPGHILWSEIEEFEYLINKDNVHESDLQKFFEKHPSFLLGSDYWNLHSQIMLTPDEGDELIPDFFAERIGTNFSDIIELKKPSEKLIVGKKNRRGFSSAVTMALNQVREYRRFFDDISNRVQFYNKYGFRAYKPKICVIIGRSSEYLNYIERVKILEEYQNLEVMTYDDILKRAKHLAII